MNIIEDYLKIYERETTITLIRFSLNKYFKFIKTTPEKYIKRDRQKIKNDIISFRNSINKLAPYTISNYINNVRSFLEYHDVDLNDKFWKKLRSTGKIKIGLTRDRIPTITELKNILNRSTLFQKTIILIALSSGTRIGEILKLELNDIDFNSKPTLINIRSEIAKNKKQRYTFITPETTNLLKEWLKDRDEYIKKSERYCVHPNTKIKPSNRKTIFPFCYQTFYNRFKKTLEQSELNEKDIQSARCIIHPHTLKKFFRTKSKIEEDYRNYFLAHTGYLPTYFKPNLDDLKKEYIKGIPNLSIFDKQYLEDDLNQQKDRILEQQKEIKELSVQNQVIIDMFEDILDNIVNDNPKVRNDLIKMLKLPKKLKINKKNNSW